MRHELITFGIASQRFGIDIMTVREIRAWSPVTRLPRVPDYVAGVVNLRGAVLPVIDLAARLGWAPTEATPRNPIIVIEYQGQMRGLIVHDVADIVSIEAGTTFGWERYADVCVGIDRFGASAPGSEVLDRLGISVANIKNSVLSLVSQR